MQHFVHPYHGDNLVTQTMRKLLTPAISLTVTVTRGCDLTLTLFRRVEGPTFMVGLTCP
jgi:hypothetical protein